MDDRMPLKQNQILVLGEFPCHISRVLGKGSNAIVYEGWYPDALDSEQRHTVLIKELYPNHPKGRIYRQEDDSLVVEAEAADFYAMHQCSFETGNRIHLRLLSEHPDLLGANLNSYSANHTLYSLLGYSGGRSLQDALNESAGELRSCTKIMLGILDALEAFHKSGYLHLDISPDNIMLVGKKTQERVFLIDYNSARAVQGENTDYLSYKAGYSAPEVEAGETEALDFSSDLYSVAAVFYHCLMGRTMTLKECLQPHAPDGSGSPMLEDAPQTVKSLVKQILRKGLNVLQRKRYGNIDRMREAFRELLDRIDCVGVTQWSLWESGRRSVEAMISANPSLHYIREEAGLYPIRIKLHDKTLSLEEYLDRIIDADGSSGILLARGGMGKTTLLMHTALQKGTQYTPTSPSVFYLSLSGWKFGQADYIKHQILSNLRFKPEENTYQSAMHALNQILQEPIRTKQGNRPMMLLLLDGLNEIQGDSVPLLEEIQELNKLAGIRILGASRSAVEELKMDTAELSELQIEDVKSVLGQQGLLVPENAKMLELLRTPLILSIYSSTSRIGKQPEAENESELLRAYLRSLYEKEVCHLPENASERWQIRAALEYVLPSIAAKGAGLTETELLKVVGECRKTIRSKTMLRAFPQWIGHSREILGDTETAEQWLGLMVYTVLWHRLGLLVQFPDGRYQVFHQNVREYLKKEGIGLHRRIQKLRWLRKTVVLLFLLAGMIMVQIFVMPKSYDDTQTEAVLDNLVSCYGAYGQRFRSTEQRLELLENGETEEFLDWTERDLSREDAADMVFMNEHSQEEYRKNVSELCQSGDKVSWSGQPMDQKAAQELITETGTQAEAYRHYLEQLMFWAGSERAQAAAKEFPDELRELLDADAELMSKLYYTSCAVHLEEADPVLREKYEKSFSSFAYSGEEPKQSIKSLKDEREAKRKALTRSSTLLQKMALKER